MCCKYELRFSSLIKNSNYYQNIIKKNYFKIKGYDGYIIQHPSNRIHSDIVIIIQPS